MIGIRQTQDPPINTLLTRISAVIGIAACLGDLFLTYLLETWYPGFRPSYQPMSDLGHTGSPVAAIASTWWVILGLMFIIFGFGFHNAFPNHGKPAKAAAWMLALYGIGEGFGSGMIASSPGKSFQTPSSIIHNLLGGVGVVAAFLLPFMLMKICDARRRPGLYWYSWFTTVTGISFFVLFSIATFYHPIGIWISCLGLWQRLFMLVYYMFFIRLAALMLSAKNLVEPLAFNANRR